MPHPAPSNGQQYLVADHMRREVHTLSKTATLRDAIVKMNECHTNGLVVVNGDQKVVGILSSWDIIQHIIPDYLEEDKHLAPFESGDLFAERIRETANEPVTKFMTRKVVTVSEADTLMEAATLLSEFRIRQLPVADASGKLVGYINRTDIRRAIGHVLGI